MVISGCTSNVQTLLLSSSNLMFLAMAAPTWLRPPLWRCSSRHLKQGDAAIKAWHDWHPRKIRLISGLWDVLFYEFVYFLKWQCSIPGEQRISDEDWWFQRITTVTVHQGSTSQQLGIVVIEYVCNNQPPMFFFNGFIPYKIVKYESLGIGQSIEYCLYHAVSSFVGTLMVFVSPHLFAGNQTHHPMFHGVSPESPSSTGDLPENYQFATPRRVRLADSSSTCAACGCVFCATVTMWWFPKTDRIYIYISI